MNNEKEYNFLKILVQWELLGIFGGIFKAKR